VFLVHVHTPHTIHLAWCDDGGCWFSLWLCLSCTKQRLRRVGPPAQVKMACTVCFGSTTTAFISCGVKIGFSTVQLPEDTVVSIRPGMALDWLAILDCQEEHLTHVATSHLWQELLSYIMYLIAFWHLKKPPYPPFRTFQLVGWLNLITSEFCFPFFDIENLTQTPTHPKQGKLTKFTLEKKFKIFPISFFEKMNKISPLEKTLLITHSLLLCPITCKLSSSPEQSLMCGNLCHSCQVPSP
jgi:hypothetical protein